MEGLDYVLTGRSPGATAVTLRQPYVAPSPGVSRPGSRRYTATGSGFTVSVTLTDKLKQLLDSKVFVNVATIQPDGSPQVSPVWVMRDGDDLLISTVRDRRKAKNLERDPRVTVVVQPADEPYAYAEIRGSVDMTANGGQKLIDELARKYVGTDYAEFNPTAADEAERLVVRVSARKVVGQGGLA